MSIIDTLITDRTQADVDLVRSLNAKGIENMTAEELTAWMEQLKGAYNYTDLNRVSRAVEYVSAEISAAGYALPELAIKTDWTQEDKPTAEELADYLQAVKNIRETLDLAAGTPEAPEDMVGLTWQEANDIERILIAVEESVQLIIEGYIYSGEVQSAEAW